MPVAVDPCRHPHPPGFAVVAQCRAGPPCWKCRREKVICLLMERPSKRGHFLEGMACSPFHVRHPLSRACSQRSRKMYKSKTNKSIRDGKIADVTKNTRNFNILPEISSPFGGNEKYFRTFHTRYYFPIGRLIFIIISDPSNTQLLFFYLSCILSTRLSKFSLARAHAPLSRASCPISRGHS